MSAMFRELTSARFPSRAREETRESRGMPCLFLNTERGFGGKPSKKSGFRRRLAGSKMPKEGSKMPKETNGDRNDVETRELFASDVMPHFA